LIVDDVISVQKMCNYVNLFSAAYRSVYSLYSMNYCRTLYFCCNLISRFWNM